MTEKKPNLSPELIERATRRIPLPTRSSTLDDDDKIAALDTYRTFEDLFIGRLQKIKMPVPEKIWEQHIKDCDAEIAISTKKSQINSLLKSKIRRDAPCGNPLISYAEATNAFGNTLRERASKEAWHEAAKEYITIRNLHIKIAQETWQGNETETLAKDLAKLLCDEAAYDKVAATPEDATKAAMQVVEAAKKAKQEALGLTKPRGRAL